MTRDRTDFDPATALARITGATSRLLATAAAFTDDDVRAPSLLPGWSRGHVLTHLARNADGGRNLLSWARTGTKTPEYPSLTARDEQIASGAGRTAAELLADLRACADAFEAEYRRMPPEAWQRPVRWTRGQEHPAARAADARLSELLIHHADLDAGYTPADWPPDFVSTMLGRVVASFTARENAPAMRLRATDTGARHTIGTERLPPTVAGPQHALLSWLLGRSPGTGLAVDHAATLPSPPFLY
ncbi:maleylpyruvate isomerase family mycothiol-dependent enzyme [Streptomyces sp. LaBMicrA B280]|uniref:maleylpyruvate isomerase family mycothiol-dependent enzyme n=1 Tax=Streptomyces sp. LaBMicrA B280 TaxID=3391001 RepID=UPI003BA77079